MPMCFETNPGFLLDGESGLVVVYSCRLSLPDCAALVQYDNGDPFLLPSSMMVWSEHLRRAGGSLSPRALTVQYHSSHLLRADGTSENGPKVLASWPTLLKTSRRFP